MIGAALMAPPSSGAVDHDAPLVAREPLEGAYVLLTFRHPEVARTARAGQFVMIKAGRSAEPPLRRPFSILRTEAASDAFSLFVKAVGPGSRALAAMAVGETARCLGPLGRPFSAPAPGREALLVAGGYGIAPFLLFSRELRGGGVTPRVFYGGRTRGDLQLIELFAELDVSVTAATQDGSYGQRGLVTEPLERYLDSTHGTRALYACGPDAMMHAVARVAAARELPAQVSLDPWMGCGIGTCLGCIVRTQSAHEPAPRNRCACTEGPVFDADAVVWPGEACSLARRRSGVHA
jgi:dihydroorotate dehydrogenase electron transfer subunit